MSPFPADLVALGAEVLDLARPRGVRVATAESCTGGLVIGVLTETPGSGDVVDRGLVTYCNDAKTRLLGVDPNLLAQHGAVSEPVVRAMAEGARRACDAQLAVAVTGVAGPSGGSEAKPVGLVWFATARDGGATVAVERRFGDIGRSDVRMASVRQALEMLRARLETGPQAEAGSGIAGSGMAGA